MGHCDFDRWNGRTIDQQLIMKRILAAVVIYAAPALVFAATPKTFSELASLVVNVINALTVLLVLVALVVYLLNISMFTGKAGEERAKMKSVILWGMLALFVMVSIWGILRLLQATLFP